jgi:hypothetical protein
LVKFRVGVGNGDFGDMNILDSDGTALKSGSRVAERDIVQVRSIWLQKFNTLKENA